MVTIFTDGSARGNPGPGGWGVVILTDDKAIELGGREDHTTNNRMELLAVISALDSVLQEREMTIYTDSAYVVNGITRWVIGWNKNKWKTSKKEDVLNKDLWKRLDDARKHKIIDWKLIKGHSGTAGNERCDVIATSFADRVPVVLYSGSRQRYGVDVSIKETKTSKKSKSKSRAYSYISMVDGVVEVHKTWEECKKRVHGVNAKYKKSISPENEEEIIKEFTE
ncbi:MAG: ribonuclease HI [Candidatus Paceibacterota bacterium]|jgi:ribonuclease HI